MARVTLYWHGGSSYAIPDIDSAEVFESLREARIEFIHRANPRETRYPCVERVPPLEDGPTAWLFFGEEHPVIGREYPDRVLEFGPRGGAICYKP